MYQVYPNISFLKIRYDMDMTWIWHFAKKYTWCCNIHVISMGYDIKCGVCERVWVSRCDSFCTAAGHGTSRAIPVGSGLHGRPSRLDQHWWWWLRISIVHQFATCQPEPVTGSDRQKVVSLLWCTFGTHRTFKSRFNVPEHWHKSKVCLRATKT